MVKYKPKCCVVPGCRDKVSPRHRFPNPKRDGNDIFKMWVQRINNPKLFTLTKQRIYITYCVCDRHFDEDCRVPGWVRLKKGSVPSLLLPDRPNDNSNKGSLPLTGEFGPGIDLPLTETGSQDLQQINSDDILSNLESFDLEMVDVQATFPSTLFGKNTSSETTAHETSIAEASPVKTKLIPEPDSEEATQQEISDADACDIIQIETESSVPEKPYFKSVKSYLIDNRCITEVCRICFRSIIDEEMIKLYEDENDDSCKVKNMLTLVLPDLDLELYPNSVVCAKCTELLIYSYELKETWLTTEEKLQKIIDKKKGMKKRDADLVIVAKAVKQQDTNTTNENDTSINSELISSTPPTVTKKVMQDILNYRQNESNESQMEIAVFHGDLEVTNVAQRGRSRLFANKVWGLGPYMCEKCGLIYANLKSFRTHLKKHCHGSDEPQITAIPQPERMICSICGHMFKNEDILKIHIQKHTKTLHKCELCAKEFKLEKALQSHYKYRHLRLYNYTMCHLCGKQFAYRRSLYIHLLRHNTKMLFSCHLCDKKFNMALKLQKHIRRHTDDKLECEYCGKSIKYAWSLKKHIQLYHKREGDLICEFCQRPYWKRMDLVRHKIKVHGWGPVHTETNEVCQYTHWEKFQA